MYPWIMQINYRQKVLVALRKALRPLANVLINVGIGYREFAELAKGAYVGVATDHYGIRGKPTNVSRVSAMTGLTRKEVKRLREKLADDDSVLLEETVPAAEVLNRWHDDAEFLDEYGQPLLLPINGPGLSFSALVAKSTGDIPPGAILVVLERAEAVVENDDGLVRAVKRYFIPADVEEQLERALAHAARGLFTNLNHNLIENPENAWIERVSFARNVRQGDLGKIRKICHQRGQDFVEAINEVFTAYESLNPEDNIEPDSKVVGMGVYFFEREPD